MTTIGHATIDERNKISGGQSGDQTKKEVCIRKWYNKPWHTVFRPKDSAVAEKIAKAMEQACMNDNIGYDQSQRTTLYNLARAVNWDISKINTRCETDCSALVSVCCNAAGILVNKNMYTGNEKSVLSATKKFTILTESKYVNGSEYLKRGDILLGNGHTAIVLSNGSKINISTENKTDVFFPARGYFKKGDVSPNVSKVAHFMVKTFPSYTSKKAISDTYNYYLIRAIKEFQKRCGIKVDGYLGSVTLKKLKQFGFNY